MEAVRVRVLLVVADGRRCAIPLAHVRETLRPLRYHPIPDAPAFVVGVSMLRGVATPIADLGLLVGGRALATPSRLVSLRLGESRSVGLLVDSVRGVESIEAWGTLPPLLRDAALVQELGRLDGELLTVLNCGRLLTDEHWHELVCEQASS